MELEICVDSIKSALAAENGGADRLEICSALTIDGITPSIGFCRKIKELCDIPCHVIIRPRGGNFVYSSDEIDVMLFDIEKLMDYADGFVIGSLTKCDELDIEQLKLLLKGIGDFPTTFHRAIDSSHNPLKVISKLVELTEYRDNSTRFRVLTSGGRPTASDGIPVIQEMILQSKGTNIEIMAGGGISEHNVLEIIQKTGVKSIHGSFSVIDGCSKWTSEVSVRNVKDILNNFHIV